MNRHSHRPYLALLVTLCALLLAACFEDIKQADEASAEGGGGGDSGGDSGSGTLDITFGGTGYVVHDIVPTSVSLNQGNDITTDASGGILVAGTATVTSASNQDMVIWRYNPDGTLDTTFGGTGYVVHEITAGDFDVGRSLTTDDNGNILVTGQSSSLMAIWRYNPIGSLDTTFNGSGFVTHGGIANNATGRSITIDSSGKLLVAGDGTDGTGMNRDMIIWRYNPDGMLDLTFDADGIVSHNNAAGVNADEKGNSMTIDANGKILVAGFSCRIFDAFTFNCSDTDMVIWRYNPDGTLDTTFGGTGIVVHHNAAGGNADDRGNSMTIDATGRILVTGSSCRTFDAFSNFCADVDVVIWRYNPDGTLDTTFDGVGFVVYNDSVGIDEVRAIAIDASGGILVTGSLSSASGSMVIWRYNPDGTLDAIYQTNLSGVFIYGNSITTDANGKILVTGYSEPDAMASNMVIWRINP